VNLFNLWWTYSTFGELWWTGSIWWTGKNAPSLPKLKHDSVSCFNLRRLGAFFGGAKPPKSPPWWRDCLYIQIVKECKFTHRPYWVGSHGWADLSQKVTTYICELTTYFTYITSVMSLTPSFSFLWQWVWELSWSQCPWGLGGGHHLVCL